MPLFSISLLYNSDECIEDENEILYLESKDEESIYTQLARCLNRKDESNSANSYHSKRKDKFLSLLFLWGQYLAIRRDARNQDPPADPDTYLESLYDNPVFEHRIVLGWS